MNGYDARVWRLGGFETMKTAEQELTLTDEDRARTVAALAAAGKIGGETEGMVLTDGRSIVPGYFHACCGGETATAEMIWPGSLKADCFESVRCDFCRESPNCRWRKTVVLADVIRALGKDPENGPWHLLAESYLGSPYTREVRVSGREDTFTLRGDDFRMKIGRALGWNVVRSNAYMIGMR